MKDWRCLCRVLVAAAAVAWSLAPAGAQDRQISVLALHEARRESPVPAAADPILQRVLGEGLSGRLDYYSEYMDLPRFPEPGYDDAFQKFFQAKHAGRRFDVVVTTTQAVFDFAIRHRDHLFPGSPIVFNTALPPGGEVRNATGIVTPLTMGRTLESAIGLQPETERVFVVSGVSPFDRNYEARARAEFKPFEGRIAFTYLAGLPMRELLKRVSNLPPRSILYWVSVTEDGAGQKFMATEMIGRVSAAANAPMYAWVDLGTEQGVVGGKTLSIELAMQRLAELALRVLHGERPEAIPVVQMEPNVTVFDWRQLRRWGISESRVPPGSIVRLRQPGPWEQYRPQIVGGLLLLVLQTALITMLLIQRRWRMHAERAARETEERFRHMMDRAPIMMWTARPDATLDYFNTTCVEFTGLPLERLLGTGWLDAVHPDDVDRCVRTYTPAFEARIPFRMEYRVRRADGVYRWLLDSGVPKYEPDGRFAGFVGSTLDITDRRDAENALVESQQRYALATAAGAVGVWDWNLQTNEIYVDPKLKAMLGFEDAEIPNRLEDWGARVHPDDAAAVMAQAQACIDGRVEVYEVAHRMVHKDGRVLWFLARGSLVKPVDGEPRRMVGTDTDITERKQIEEEVLQNEASLRESNLRIQDLAGRLIASQEVERARIARDLHDGLSQDLAGLSIALSGLKRRLGPLDTTRELVDDVASLQARTIAVANSIRHLSHDLHPSVLEHAGLVATMRAHCAELGRQRDVHIAFSAQGEFAGLDRDLALCLYRVAQEALRNVVTHADARRAEVSLHGADDHIELIVADDGKGFDIVATREGNRGLGLVSMNERVRLAGGTVSLLTELNRGTTVRVRLARANRGAGPFAAV